MCVVREIQPAQSDLQGDAEWLVIAGTLGLVEKPVPSDTPATCSTTCKQDIKQVSYNCQNGNGTARMGMRKLEWE